jgi:hypothetical protein
LCQQHPKIQTRKYNKKKRKPVKKQKSNVIFSPWTYTFYIYIYGPQHKIIDSFLTTNIFINLVFFFNLVCRGQGWVR